MARNNVRFEAAGFGTLASAFGLQSFDALLCLGNSLSHLVTPADLASALLDFAAVLRPGGLLLVQNRNFDAVMVQRQRWMEPQACKEGDEEWLFLRFYDFEPDGLINFNVVTLHRQDLAPWSQQVSGTCLRPLMQEELSQALLAANFSQITCYGDMNGAVFKPASSGNLIITARRSTDGA